MKHHVNIIPWGTLTAGTYTYGSSIKISPLGNVTYDQPFLPIGTTIHTWQSVTNFQANRIMPQLPQLLPNNVYQIRLNATSQPANTLFLRVTFYDRYAQLLDTVIIKDLAGTFVVPKTMYNYQVELFNAGCQSFIFYEMTIERIDNIDQAVEPQLTLGYDLNYCLVDESEPDFSDVRVLDNGTTRNNSTSRFAWFKKKTIENVSHSLEGTPLTVVIVEPDFRRLSVRQIKAIMSQEDTCIVTTTFKDARLYLSEAFEQALIEQYQGVQRHFDVSQMRFIGYGPISNLAAAYYQSILSKSVAFISEEVLSTATLSAYLNEYGRIFSDRACNFVQNIIKQPEGQYSNFATVIHTPQNSVVRTPHMIGETAVMPQFHSREHQLERIFNAIKGGDMLV